MGVCSEFAPDVKGFAALACRRLGMQGRAGVSACGSETCTETVVDEKMLSSAVDVGRSNH